MSIQVTAVGPVSMHDLTDLHGELASRLAASGMVGQVVRDSAGSELVVRASILRRTQRESFFDTGPVELTVGVQLLDNLRHQVVGQFDATSSSNKPVYRGDEEHSRLRRRGGGLDPQLGSGDWRTTDDDDEQDLRGGPSIDLSGWRGQLMGGIVAY